VAGSLIINFKTEAMKSFYKSASYSIVVVCLILFSHSNYSNAQGAYSGGAGGGYASYTISSSTSINQPETSVTKKLDVTIYPNPLSSSESLKAKLSGFPIDQKVSVVITDMIGSRLHFEEIDVADEITLNISHDRFTKGIYLITFQYNSIKITRRFSYKN
jgi:hypothetical protein